MLQLDSLLLDAFYKENKDYFFNARIQKIQQPTRREVILHLRNMSESRKLYININPSCYHVCFMSKENETRRNIKIPKQPPMFCMLLRKHMEGAKILKINKPEYERILELVFENYNELGDRVEECLAIELMGKHSNIVLYNTDNNIILGCAHNVGAEKSKERELAGGLPYVYPPKQDKKNILLTRYNSFKSSLEKSEKSLKVTISEKYFCLSQALIEEICELNNIDATLVSKNISEKYIQLLFVALHEYFENNKTVYSVNNDFSKYSNLKILGIEYNNINSLIDDYFAYNIEKVMIDSLKSSLMMKVNKELQKQQNILKNQQKQVSKKEKADLYLKKGNLLTSYAYSLNTYEKKVLLYDYENNENIEIDLDETLTVIDNAKRFFNLYNKTKKAWLVAEEMSKNTQEEIDYLKQLIYDIEQSSNLDDIKDSANDFFQELSEPQKKKEQNVKIEKKDIDGFDVYIGRNSKQNDYLYSKISSSDDMWFHTLNTPGSHIIVKAHNSKQLLSDNTILKIAKLAKEHSIAKNSTKVSVVYTQRKYIKRPINTKSGFVVYKNESEIVVD